MKLFCALLFIFSLSFLAPAQTDTVISKVYLFNSLTPEKLGGYEKREIFNGITTDNENLNVYAIALEPQKFFNNIKADGDAETLIIIKEGKLKVTLKDESKILTAGSIVYLMPDENYSIVNAADTNSTYYVLEYNSKKITSTEEESKAASSFMLAWEDIKFNPHDRGGVRPYYEQPTSMFRRFEMHVTTLNAGIKSHEPHTHRAEEIVLMIKGDSEMQIGEDFHKGSDGDLFFLGSNIPHAIRNTDNEQIMYFAFQWD